MSGSPLHVTRDDVDTLRRAAMLLNGVDAKVAGAVIDKLADLRRRIEASL